MNRDQVVMEVKFGWKVYQLLTSILVIGCFAFLMKRMAEMSKYTGAGGIFLLLFFALFIVGMIYNVIYNFRHHIIFDKSGLTRRGIVNEKVIAYADIDHLHFSDSIWKAGNLSNLPLSKGKVLINAQYTNYDEALVYLREILNSEEIQLTEA